MVVPGKEVLAKAPGILNGPETIRVIGPVFLEVGFGKRIIVRDMRAAVRFDDPEVGQQQGRLWKQLFYIRAS